MKILRAGYLYVALTLTIGVAAVNTLNNLLYLIVAGLLALMAISGAVAYLALRRLDLEVELPNEWFAKRSALLVIRIHNRRRYLPTFLLRLDNSLHHTTLVEIPPRHTTEAQLLFHPETRGYVDLGVLTITSEFPFGLFRRGGIVPLGTKVLVYPTPEETAKPAGDASSDASPATAGCTSYRGFGGDYKETRTYQPGDPPARIDWKVYGRLGLLGTKEFDEETGTPLVLTLDSVPGPDTEARLRQLTALVLRAAEESRPVGLRLTREAMEPGIGAQHRERLLRMLALYQA
ncbi:MAG: DUF58 domain-containing protein [Actinobacteria bacterium]|nr:DUF58 domain-containing protein [Actinomycetota bacterium]